MFILPKMLDGDQTHWSHYLYMNWVSFALLSPNTKASISANILNVPIAYINKKHQPVLKNATPFNQFFSWWPQFNIFLCKPSTFVIHCYMITCLLIQLFSVLYYFILFYYCTIIRILYNYIFINWYYVKQCLFYFMSVTLTPKIQIHNHGGKEGFIYSTIRRYKYWIFSNFSKTANFIKNSTVIILTFLKTTIHHFKLYQESENVDVSRFAPLLPIPYRYIWKEWFFWSYQCKSKMSAMPQNMVFAKWTLKIERFICEVINEICYTIDPLSHLIIFQECIPRYYLSACGQSLHYSNKCL